MNPDDPDYATIKYRHRLIDKHQRWAIKQAKIGWSLLSKRYPRLTFQDCLDAAILGMIESVQTYDFRFSKFSTYSKRMMIFRIQNAARCSSLIKLPGVNVFRKLRETSKQAAHRAWATRSIDHASFDKTVDNESIEAFERRDVVEEVLRQADRLPPRYRDAVKGFFEGKTDLEQARAWGVSKARVNKIRLRAFARIRDRMGDDYDGIV